MTSKQLGIVTLIVALVTLWSLAGIGWLSWTSAPTDGSILVISEAYAGDPDAMTDDPESNSGESEDAPVVEEPPVDPDRDEEDVPDDDIIEYMVQIASLFLKTGGVLF
jgi:hypothetical protein